MKRTTLFWGEGLWVPMMRLIGGLALPPIKLRRSALAVEYLVAQTTRQRAIYKQF